MIREPQKTQSLCPDCGRPIPAAYVHRGSAMYLEKVCPVHGVSRVLASEDAGAFERWATFPSVTVPPRVFITKGAAGANECPLHCGVCENHMMTACCVLLNVTDRCNQRCPYCFASADNVGDAALGVSPPDPPLADIAHWLDRLTELGEERKFNIQLNGGEPTVREDLPEIISLCKTKGFEYVQLNTNGRRLAEDAAYTKELKDAGLSTVFLQFDGVTDDVYIALRGEPLFETKKLAIKNCAAAGLPVTLVPTVLKNTNLSECGRVIDFMLENISVVKGVHFQPASFFGRRPGERNADGDFDERVTMFGVMDAIEVQTGRRIKKADLAPITTGHPLCCFCAAYIKEADGVLRPLSSGGICCSDASEPNPLEIIRRDRDFVLNKWDIASPCCSETPSSSLRGGGRIAAARSASFAPTRQSSAQPALSVSLPIPSFDEAIAMFKATQFTISCMAFMDETNLDAERLRRCRVQVFTEEERLVPFCGYYTYGSGGTPRAASPTAPHTRI